MKKIILAALMLWSVAYGQTPYYIRADSTRLEKVGGNNELILLNSTRNTTGVLVNNGGGRTTFFKPKIVGSTLIIGKDTLTLPGSGGSTDTASLSNRINGKVDQVYVNGSDDSLIVEKNGTRTAYLLPSGGGTDRLGVTTFYMSKEGAVSDADITMHSLSGLGTNNQSVFNTVFATNGPIDVYVDGRYSLDSLRLHSNTRLIILPGCGIIQRGSIDAAFVANVNRTAGAIVDTAIFIGGGGTINGYGNNAAGTYQRNYSGYGGGFNTVLNFRGVKNLQLDNIAVMNGRCLLSLVSNAVDVDFNNVTWDQSPVLSTSELIHDGPKFLGPITGLRMTNNSMYTIDDAWSIVSNDVFSPIPGTTVFGLNTYDPFASHGNITNYLVDGIVLRNTYHGFRLLSTTDSLKNGTMRNISGTVRYYIGVMDRGPTFQCYGSGSNDSLGYIDNLIIENMNLESTIDGSVAGINLQMKWGTITFNNWTHSNIHSSGVLIRNPSGITPGTLNINGFRSKPTENQTFAIVHSQAGAKINFSDVQIDRSAYSADGSPLVYNQGNSALITMSDVTTYNVNNLIENASGTITDIRATGITHQNAGSEATFKVSAGAITNLTMSSFVGGTKTSGTVTNTYGDAFVTAATIGGSIASDQVATGNGTNSIAGSSFFTNNGSVVKVGAGTAMGLTGESLVFQSVAASGASGSVFGTNAAGSAGYLDIMSGGTFYHLVNTGTSGSNRLDLRYATFSGATASYSNPLLTVATNGNIGINNVPSPAEKLVVNGYVAINAPAYSSGGRVMLVHNSTSGRLETEAVPTLIRDEFTPIYTGGTNVGTITHIRAYYDRIGDYVTAHVRFTAAWTANSTTSLLSISLPVASNLASTTVVGQGTFGPSSTFFPTSGGYVVADATNDRVDFNFTSLSIGSPGNFDITFTYKVQ